MPNSLKNNLESELSKIEEEKIFSSEYRSKKLITYLIRTGLALTLYILFWQHQWVKWSLTVYIPLNLLSLFSIFGLYYLLKRKLERVRRKINGSKND